MCVCAYKIVFLHMHYHKIKRRESKEQQSTALVEVHTVTNVTDAPYRLFEPLSTVVDRAADPQRGSLDSCETYAQHGPIRGGHATTTNATLPRDWCGMHSLTNTKSQRLEVMSAIAGECDC